MVETSITQHSGLVIDISLTSDETLELIADHIRDNPAKYGVPVHLDFSKASVEVTGLGDYWTGEGRGLTITLDSRAKKTEDVE